MATDISHDMTINQVLRLYPQVMGVFNTFKMDSCCGGARSLEQAAQEDGVAIEALLAALSERLSALRSPIPCSDRTPSESQAAEGRG